MEDGKAGPYPQLGEQEFKRRLAGASGIWLPAYDQDRLPQLFADDDPNTLSDFQRELRRIVADGGAVGALGGGASSLPETVIAGDADFEHGWIRAQLRFGLDLFHGAVVDQNFSSRTGRLERMTDLLRNGVRLNRLDGVPGIERRTIGLGVDRYTALILEQNTVRVIGEGKGHVFLKSNGDRTVTWRMIEEGIPPLVIKTGLDPADAARPKLSRVDNPFGMPAPADGRTWGTVVLHGGGSTGEIMNLYPKLAAAHPDLKPNELPRFVHCPAAIRSRLLSAIVGDYSDEVRRHRHQERLNTIFADWKEMETDAENRRFASVTFAAPDDDRTLGQADDPKFVEPLTAAHAVWFSGGDQAVLAKLFVNQDSTAAPTKFQQAIVDVVARGGVVGGTSAGLAIMPSVIIADETGDGGRPRKADLRLGFGVLKNVFAEQHFDARTGRIERFTEQLRSPELPAGAKPAERPERMIGIAVEEDTALLLQGDRVRVTGAKSAHLFLLGKDRRIVTWHALKSGDAATVLQNTAGEFVLELEDWRFGD